MDTYHHQAEDIHTLNLVYSAKIKSGRLRAMSDVSELAWFSRQGIPWKSLAFPWLKKALRVWVKS